MSASACSGTRRRARSRTLFTVVLVDVLALVVVALAVVVVVELTCGRAQKKKSLARKREREMTEIEFEKSSANLRRPVIGPDPRLPVKAQGRQAAQGHRLGRGARRGRGRGRDARDFRDSDHSNDDDADSPQNCLRKAALLLLASPRQTGYPGPKGTQRRPEGAKGGFHPRVSPWDTISVFPLGSPPLDLARNRTSPNPLPPPGTYPYPRYATHCPSGSLPGRASLIRITPTRGKCIFFSDNFQ